MSINDGSLRLRGAAIFSIPEKKLILKTITNRRYPALYFVFTLLITATYFPVLSAGFVGDDTAFIINNSDNLHLSNLWSFFTSGVWSHGNIVVGDQSIYRPVWLTWISVNSFFLNENPTAWHLSNILLHALNTTLYLYLLKQVTQRIAPITMIALTALLCLHPVMSHNVSWISGSTDLLLVSFLLASWICLNKAIHSMQSSWLHLSFTFFILALLTKETALAFSIIFVWLTFRRNLFKQAVMQLTVTLSIYFILRYLALGSTTGETQTWEFSGENFSRASEYLSVYLRSLIIPFPLDFTLSHNDIDIRSLGDPLAGFIILSTIIWIMLTKPDYRFVALIACAPLSLPILMAFNNLGLYGVRFLYPCMPGFILLFARIVEKQNMPVNALNSSLIALLMVFATLTNIESRHWLSPETWSNKVLESEPDRFGLWDSKAKYKLETEGLNSAAATYEEALTRFQGTTGYGKLLEAYAIMLAKEGKIQNSITKFQHLYEIKGFEANGWVGIGNIYWMSRQLNQAISAYEKALKFEPDHLIAQYNLITLLRQQKRFQEAQKVIDQIKQNPRLENSPGMAARVKDL